MKPTYWYASYAGRGCTVLKQSRRPSQKELRYIFDCSGTVEVRRATEKDIDHVRSFGGGIHGETP